MVTSKFFCIASPTLYLLAQGNHALVLNTVTKPCLTPTRLHSHFNPSAQFTQSSHSEDGEELYSNEPEEPANQGDNFLYKGNRFSKFAPSADLEADEFRNQLKENMKKELERRRNEDPNRGNQPAKSYLDGL